MPQFRQLLFTSTILLSLSLLANPTEIPGTNGIPDLTKVGHAESSNFVYEVQG